MKKIDGIPSGRRWVDVTAVDVRHSFAGYNYFFAGYNYIARPRSDPGAVTPLAGKGNPKRPRMSPVKSDKTMLEYLNDPVLYVFTGTWSRHAATEEARRMVTLANCIPRPGGYYNDIYIEMFHGPRDEAIECFMRHRDLWLHP